MHASLGEYLKRLRTERRLSLEGIAQRTRIHQPYLEALEEDDFTRLPPAFVFAKAYLKAYSRCLALSAEEDAEVMLRFVELANEHYKTIMPGEPFLVGAGCNGTADKPGAKAAVAGLRLFR